jgi:hypothetical protein
LGQEVAAGRQLVPDRLPGSHDGKGDGAKNVSEVAVTPVFRLLRADREGPYFEVGVGAHLASAKRVNREREFGSHFNFGTHVGVGMLFGDKALRFLAAHGACAFSRARLCPMSVENLHAVG